MLWGVPSGSDEKGDVGFPEGAAGDGFCNIVPLHANIRRTRAIQQRRAEVVRVAL